MPIYVLSFHKLVQTGYFSSAFPMERRDRVVVAIDQGTVLARAVSGPHTDLEDMGEDSLPMVIRPAGEEDLEQERGNAALAARAGAFWKERVRARELAMKLVDVEIFLDRSKIIFYFTSTSRIDFRELVKDLVHEYRVRIEFRQIGVRHETQMIGAVGNCGMVCCCRRFLTEFAPVTIRMAKEQNLFLNPAKVSGMCGRLLCCLAYEQDSYEKFHNDSPRLGKRYVTSDGQFRVVRSNMFSNTVTCLSEGGEEVKFTLEEWNGRGPRRVDGSVPPSKREEPEPAPQPESPQTAQAVPAAKAQAKTRAEAKPEKERRQTFVTGRVSFRKRTRSRSQEVQKKRAVAQQQEAKPSRSAAPPEKPQAKQPRGPTQEAQTQRRLPKARQGAQPPDQQDSAKKTGGRRQEQ